MGLWWGGYSQPRLQLLYEKCIGILFDTSIDYLFWFLCDYVKSTLSWSIQASSWTWWASSWTPMSWFQLWRTSTKTSKSRSRMLMMIACEKWSMMMNWSLWVLSKCCRFHHRSGQLEFDEFVTLSARCKKEQDPVSTMQKTGWTNNSAFQSGHSSSMVLFGPVCCGLAYGVLITWMQSPTICLYT